MTRRMERFVKWVDANPLVKGLYEYLGILLAMYIIIETVVVPIYG